LIKGSKDSDYSLVSNENFSEILSSSGGVPNLSLTMCPFSILTDEHVLPKFLMTKTGYNKKNPLNHKIAHNPWM